MFTTSRKPYNNTTSSLQPTQDIEHVISVALLSHHVGIATQMCTFASGLGLPNRTKCFFWAVTYVLLFIMGCSSLCLRRWLSEQVREASSDLGLMILDPLGYVLYSGAH